MKVIANFGANFKEYEIDKITILARDKPLQLDSKIEISNFPLAYQTYGKLNNNKSNAILVCHALTGDQYLANKNPITGKDGWWQFMVGPNKSIDTNKFFVICSNVLGGCMGSFGPKENNQVKNKPYGLDFPIITIADMVKAQNLLIKSFGIEKLYAIIGGSTGGMQVLSWLNLFPNQINIAIPMATSYHHSPQNIAFHEVGRQAIMADNNWCGGDYLAEKKFPSQGLAVARMTAHITYLSQISLHKKFGRDLKNQHKSFSFNKDFEVESYLHHQGQRFVERFDPNSYLYITKAVDYFDLETDNNNNLSFAFSGFAENKTGKICLITFSDDWLFPPTESKKITQAMAKIGIDVSLVVIDSENGHDSFLLPNSILEKTVAGIINNSKSSTYTISNL
jgi:homoserine O-acetyltransferase